MSYSEEFEDSYLNEISLQLEKTRQNMSIFMSQVKSNLLALVSDGEPYIDKFMETSLKTRMNPLYLFRIHGTRTEEELNILSRDMANEYGNLFRNMVFESKKEDI
jgi:hypothetical protein